jgi:preprotein translocase subunit SecF
VAQNLLIMLLSYALFRIEIGASVISAVLVSIALSTVSLAVVFDSIRALWKAGGKDDFAAVANSGITESVKLDSKLLLASVLIICVLMFSGTAALRSICIPLLFTNVAAWYSSVLLGGPLWAIFGGMKAPKTKK